MKLLDRLPNWLRSGVVTGALAATVTTGASILSWLEGFFEWAAGAPVEFPDISVLRSALVGIAAGAALGGANALWRRVQQATNSGAPPVYIARPDEPGVIRRTIRYRPQIHARRGED